MCVLLKVHISISKLVHSCCNREACCFGFVVWLSDVHDTGYLFKSYLCLFVKDDGTHERT